MRVKKNARAFVPEEVFDRKTLLLSNQKENVKRLTTAYVTSALVHPDLTSQ